MGTWRMDVKTARHLADHLMEMPKRFPIYECEKCGSTYLEELGHECGNYIDLVCETREVEDDE